MRIEFQRWRTATNHDFSRAIDFQATGSFVVQRCCPSLTARAVRWSPWATSRVFPTRKIFRDRPERVFFHSTLVVVLSEFGRTPKINPRYGRDHWGTAWSVCLGGCGIQAGADYGKTNDEGTEVVENEVDAGHLFHTYLKALGLRSTSSFEIGGRKFLMADPAFEPIKDILA